MPASEMGRGAAAADAEIQMREATELPFAPATAPATDAGREDGEVRMHDEARLRDEAWLSDKKRLNDGAVVLRPLPAAQPVMRRSYMIMAPGPLPTFPLAVRRRYLIVVGCCPRRRDAVTVG
jgi:hypothetical protein